MLASPIMLREVYKYVVTQREKEISKGHNYLADRWIIRPPEERTSKV